MRKKKQNGRQRQQELWRFQFLFPAEAKQRKEELEEEGLMIGTTWPTTWRHVAPLFPTTWQARPTWRPLFASPQGEGRSLGKRKRHVISHLAVIRGKDQSRGVHVLSPVGHRPRSHVGRPMGIRRLRSTQPVLPRVGDDGLSGRPFHVILSLSAFTLVRPLLLSVSAFTLVISPRLRSGAPTIGSITDGKN